MYDFHLAISFAGEDRAIAYALAEKLHTHYTYRVFYDDYEQANLLGTNLTEYLIDIYKNKARYCIILISKDYKLKRWTRHEWRAAQARAFEEPELDYILPLRIDDTELPGLLPTVGFLSLNWENLEHVCKTIHQKVASEIETLKVLALAEKYYNNNKIPEALNLIIDAKYDSYIEGNRIRGNCYGKLHQYEKGIESFKKVLDRIPSDFMANFLVGIYSFRIGDYVNSVHYYEIAEKIYPNHPTIKSDLPAARKKLNEL